MAIPITKKVAASCAKNMEEGTITYQIDKELAGKLIDNAGKTAPEFNDAKKNLMAGFDNVKSKDKEDDEA
jgi:hypothetical protein